MITRFPLQGSFRGSLQRKILIIFLLLGVGLLLGTFAALRLFVFPTFEDFEREQSIVSLSQVDRALEKYLRSVQVFAWEYAQWDDTYHYAAGVVHKINNQWTVQGGISYDTNPADKGFRTADLPVDRQVRYAFGALHTRPSGLEIGAHFVYADYGSAKIDALGFAGDFSSNNLYFASMSFNWRL